MKKAIFIAIIAIFVMALAMPVLPVLAWNSHYQNGRYNYLSTETGTNIRHIERHVYRLREQKLNFNTNEPVIVLSKITDINGIDAFRFQYSLYGQGHGFSRVEYGNVFSPHYSNWPETISSWNQFDNLPSGSYELKVAISINNGQYHQIDTKHFSVGSNYYPAPSSHPSYTTPAGYNPPYYYSQSSSYYARPHYSYSWTHIGAGVRQTGAYSYEIVSSRVNFNRDEDVRVLTKLANIEGIGRFRIKHEIYRRSGTHYRTNEAPIQYPGRSLWKYNYTAVNFNRLPAGDYEVRTYISIDGGRYASLGKKNFSVAGYERDYWHDRDYRDHWRRSYGGCYSYGNYPYYCGY